MFAGILIVAYPVVYGRLWSLLWFPVVEGDELEIIQNGVSAKLDFGLLEFYFHFNDANSWTSGTQVRLIRTKGKLLV